MNQHLANALPRVQAVAAFAPDGWRQGRLRRRRRLWLQVHLWLALSAGAVFVLVGLTGGLLAFGAEIDRWLNRELLTVTPPAETEAHRSLDELVGVLKSAMPPAGVPNRLQFPRAVDQALCLQYTVPVPRSRYGGDYYQACVDPYTAKLLGQRLQLGADSIFAEQLTWLVIDLHAGLLLRGLGGETVVGIIAVLLMISVLTGLYLWWPPTSKWRQALTIKRHARPERLNFDLHKTFASYSALVLLVLLFTGIYMNLPQYVKPLVEVFSPLTAWPEGLKSTPVPGQTPITPGQALAIAERLFPDGELVIMPLPDGPEGVYAIGKRAPDEVGSWPYRHVWLDQYSGEILHMQDPHQGTGGDKFLEWQFPLHTGDAFGLPGRILVCITGFVPTVLYITGFIRWRQKARANRRSHVRTAKTQAQLIRTAVPEWVSENGAEEVGKITAETAQGRR